MTSKGGRYVFTATKLLDSCGVAVGDCWLLGRCSEADLELLDITELGSRVIPSGDVFVKSGIITIRK